MQCDEKRKICLNYAANVPEWTLALQLDAVAKLNKAANMCNKISSMIVGGLSYNKLHPNSIWGEDTPSGLDFACHDAANSFGDAVCALEVLLSQAYMFDTAASLANYADIAYHTGQLNLESLCRKHGCPEVAYRHDKN